LRARFVAVVLGLCAWLLASAATDGRGFRAATSSTATNWGVTWSPDGRKIAFASDAASLHFHLEVMDVRSWTRSQADELILLGDGARMVTATIRDRVRRRSKRGLRDSQPDLELGIGGDLRRPPRPPRPAAADAKPRGRSDAGLGAERIADRFRTVARLPESDDLYVMAPDGSHQRLLVRNIDAADGIAWSPTGRSIAFSRAPNVFVVDVESGRSIDLTSRLQRSLNAGFQSPSWSPDGRRLSVNAVDLGGDNVSAYVGDVNGRRLQQVVPWVPAVDYDDGFGNRAAWLADGKSLVASAGDSLYLVKLPARTLTIIAPNASFPRISPERRRIVYEARTPPSGYALVGSSVLYLIDSDGLDRRKLTR